MSRVGGRWRCYSLETACLSRARDTPRRAKHQRVLVSAWEIISDARLEKRTMRDVNARRDANSIHPPHPAMGPSQHSKVSHNQSRGQNNDSH